MTVRRTIGLVLAVHLVLGLAPLAVAQSTGSMTSELTGRRISVPLEDLHLVVDRDKQGVILSREEYAKLAALVQKQHETCPASSSAIVATKGEYTAEIVDEQLVLTALIELNQLKPGWQTLMLPYRNMAVERATLDDKPAQLARDGGKRALVLLSSHVGKHSLSLKLSTRLVSLGSDRVAALGLAPVPSGRLQLTLPAGQFLHVDETPLERPAPADQAAGYTLAIGGRTALNIRVAGRQTQQQSASLVFASTAIGLSVAAEERSWGAVTTVNVFGKPVDSLQFVIPKSLDIVSVESTGLERWEIAAGPNDATTALKLIYRQGVSETRTVAFRGVSTGGIGEPWSVPTLGLTGAISHQVHAVVRPSSGLRLQPVAATGVRRISAEEAAIETATMADKSGPTEGAAPLHYAAWREDFTLQFVTRPRSRELQATIATRVDIDARELGLRSSIAVQSRFAPLFDLDLTLPVDWQVVDVLHGNQPARWRVVPVDAGSNQIRVSFQPPIPADGKAGLTLVARRIPGENWPIAAEPLEVPLPEVFLPEVGVTDGRYMIAADADLDVEVNELTGLDPARLSQAEQRLARAPRLVYEYQDTRFQGKLRVTRRALRLAAQTLAFHRLDRETLVSHLEARLAVSGGGLQKLDLATPESAGTDLRFRIIARSATANAAPPEIIEQTSAPPAGGERVWTLRFDERVFGLLWLVVDVQSPRAADAKEYPLPALRIVAAERQHGQIAIEAGPDQQLKLTAVDSTGQPLKELDPADVMAPVDYLPRDRIVAAYQVVRPGFRIAASETRFERQPVPTAICDKATLTSVVSQTGEIQHQALFALRATGVQSLHVELPAQASFWAALIDGQPIEARAAPAGDAPSGAYLIPLQSTGDPTAARTLTILYRTSAGAIRDAGTLRQTPPRLAAVSGQGEIQPLEILERDWTVHHPEGTVITSSAGHFEPVVRPAPSSLLGDLQRNLGIESWQDVTSKGIAVLIAAGIIGALWLSFRRRGLSGTLATVVVGGSLVFLVTLLLPAVQQSREAARSSQLRNELRQMELAVANLDAFETTAGPNASTPAHASPAEASMADANDGTLSKSNSGFTPSFVQGRTRGIVNQSEPFTKYLNDIDSAGAKFTTNGQAPTPQSPIPDLQTGVTKNTFLAGGLPVSDEPADLQQKLDAALTKPGDRKGMNVDQNGNANGIALGGMGGGANDQNQEAAPAEGQPAKPPAKERLGGLLSLAIDLQADPDSRTTAFRYSGVAAPGVEPALDVVLHDRHFLSATSIAWQAGVLLLFWFARRWSAGVRATLAVACLVGPLALLPLVPFDILPYLDGLFLGAVWGLLLWAGLACAGCCLRGTCAGSRNARPTSLTTTVLLIAGTVSWLTSTAVMADEKASAELKDHRHERTEGPFYVTTLANPLQADRIFLPFDRFLELWRTAHPELEVERNPPRDALLAEALYSAEFVPAAGGVKASIAVAGRFVLHSFRAEQVTLTLPLTRVSLRAATLNGKSAPIISRQGKDGPELAVLIPERGAHVLDVGFSLPVEQTGPSGRFVLPLLPVATGSLRFTLPAADQVLRVTGASGMFRRTREGDKSIAVVPIDRGGDIALAWAPPQSRDSTEGIVHAESSTVVAIDDAGMQLTANVKFAVRQGTLSDVTFALPAGLLVRHIAGPDLAGWETNGAENQQTLKVFFQRPVNDSTTISFDLFQPHAIAEQALSLSVPQFAPRDITRETGLVGVFPAAHLSATAGSVSGLTQIDATQFAAPGIEKRSELSRAPARPQLAYRFAARPFQLSLSVIRQKPVSRGIAEHACHVGHRKMQLLSRFEVQIVGAPRSEIAVQLPMGYLLNDLKSPAAVDYYVETSAEGQPPLLHVELASPRTGAVELLLDGLLPKAADDLLPLVGVPFPVGLGELRSSLAIWLDRSYSASFEGLEGWKSIDPRELPTRLQKARQTAAQLAFASNQATVPAIVLDLTRATARLIADSLAVVMVRDTSIQHSLYLRWRITAAGEDTFTFTTPDWLADRLEIDRSLPGIRLRQVTQEKLEKNRLRWTVTLEEPRESVLFLTAHAVLPPPENARVAAPLVTFERAVAGDEGQQFVPLDNQRLHLLLINQSAQRLDRDAPEGSVEPITASELPIRIGAEISNRAAEILAVRNPAATVSWQAQSASALKALPASVNVARMTLVLAHDGTWRAQADYRVNNRSRQFLAIRLPPKSRVLSLFVANQPARPIRTDRPNEPDLLLVPLPKTALGDLSAEIRLIFEGQLDRPLPRGVQVLRSELDLPAPQILSQNEDPDFGAPVAATEWTVILPDDVDAARLDNPSRSNLVESGEGAEALIAAYQELLSLVSVASEARLQNNRRQLSRAQSNLKQLGRAIAAYDNTRSLSALSKDERQSRQLAELQQKWQSAQGEIAGFQQKMTADDRKAVDGPISQSAVQRDVLFNNTIDVAPEAGESDSETLRLEIESVEQAVPGKDGRDKSKKLSQKPASNRAALKGETATQSQSLNQAIATEQKETLPEVSQESGRGITSHLLRQNRRSLVQGEDSDGVLDLEQDYEQERYSKVPMMAPASSSDGPQRAPSGGRRSGRAVAGVPIVGKPTFLGELLAQQQDFDDLARANRGGEQNVNRNAVALAGWTQPGGLSLAITIPQAGQKLTFSKSGGDARLALGLRPRASREAGFGLIWTVTWIVVGLGLIAALGRHDATYVLRRRLPLGVVLIGLLWLFLLPAALAGFLLFVAGAVALAWQHRRA